MKNLHLNKLREGLPGVSEAVGTFMAEAAVVCLTGNGHQSGAILQVSGMVSCSFRVIWSEESDIQVKNSWLDLKEATEYGATAIALLLTLELTDYTTFQRVPQSESADYLLCKPVGKEVEIFDVPGAYLEVSGIWEEKPGNTLSMRINAKKHQVNKIQDKNLPVLIIVAEFRVPKVKITSL